jgi:hypothetical protein
MATILSQSRVCDGFDCRCELASGSVRVFHFPAEPADVQAAVDQVEAALLAAPPEPWKVSPGLFPPEGA